jgi:hypothetical protein
MARDFRITARAGDVERTDLYFPSCGSVRRTATSYPPYAKFYNSLPREVAQAEEINAWIGVPGQRTFMSINRDPVSESSSYEIRSDIRDVGSFSSPSVVGPNDDSDIECWMFRWFSNGHGHYFCA